MIQPFLLVYILFTINLALCAVGYRVRLADSREYSQASAFSPSCGGRHWPGTGQLLLAGPFYACHPHSEPSP
jgi:hypothetical protein